MEETMFDGANEQEYAEPAMGAEQGEESVTDVADAGQQPEQQEEQTKKQQVDVNAIAAAARRRAEAEYNAKLAADRRRMEGFAQARGYSSWEEMEKESVTQSLNDGMITEGLLETIVNRALENSPIIRQAQEANAQASISKEMEAFCKEFPDSGIKDVADFADMPTYDAFYAYVAKGLSYADAYTLANKDEVFQKREKAAKQAAYNSVNGKSHLQSTPPGPDTDDVRIPAETLRTYRAWFPDWSDKKIREHYKKSRSDI